MKKVTTLFLDIVCKLQNNGLRIKNIVFTRNLENINKELGKLYNERIIAEDGVGLKIKAVEKKKDCALAYSYFFDNKRVENFLYNLEDEVDNLYNIWI